MADADGLSLRLWFHEEELSHADPRFGRPVPTTAVDFTSAIYDFNLAYEIAVLRTLEEYASYDLSNFFLLGRHRPVRQQHQLGVQRASYESPLHLLAVIPRDVLYAAGSSSGVFVLARLSKIVRTVYTIDLDLKNARLRKRIEHARLEIELDEVEEKAARRLEKRVREQHRLALKKLESDDFPPASRNPPSR